MHLFIKKSFNFKSFSNEALISNQENQMHLTEENLKHHNNINKFQIITDETKDDRSPRISTTPNQPLPPNYQNDNLLLKIQNNKTTNKDFDEKQQPSVTRDNSVLTNDELFFNRKFNNFLLILKRFSQIDFF